MRHIVTSQGVKVDQTKIKVILDWPRLNNIIELRGFLSLTSYYRKFVRQYRILARLLTNLLKKGQFRWSEEAESTFQNLKVAMTTTPTLALPNFEEPFIIETDAYGCGIGAILTQHGQPIAYMRQALGVAKQSWSTYAKEMFAIVIAIKLWSLYLMGRKFYVHTDQKSLKHLLDQRITTLEQ